MRKASLTKGERAAMAAHMSQERIARGAQIVAALAGLWAATRHGLPAIALGALGWAFFGLARPGPSDKFDDWTGRGQ